MAQGYIHKQPLFGNRTGEIPINNSTNNVNLNADMLSGYHVTTGSQTSSIPIMTTGTWTPEILQGATGITYGTRSGSYVKIGSGVWIGFRLEVTAVTSNSSVLLIGPLPFVSETVFYLHCLLGNSPFHTSSTLNRQCAGGTLSGSTNIRVMLDGSDGSGSSVLRAGTEIKIEGMYITTS